MAARDRGALALVLIAVLSLVGCRAGSGEEAGTPRSSAASERSREGTASPTAESTEVTPGGRDDFAVEPPGRLSEKVAADLIIFSQDVIPDDVVRKVRRLDGVDVVQPLGLAQVTIENRAVTIAEVDAAGYRRFTELSVAKNQQVWERVAGGELAIGKKLGRRLADGNDRITLGNSDDSPRIHVGAYAKQVPTVDAVVNTVWGEALGMKYGNALLVNTGRSDPAKLRPAIERLVGRRTSVQLIDSVVRFGLDRSVKQTAFLTGGSVSEVVGTFNYTVLGGGRIAPDPGWVESHISTEPVPILGQMTCNKAIFPQLRAALKEIEDSGLADEIHPDEYAGCYYPRFIAGTTTLSNHSFGLAFDINVPGNQRGTVGEIDRTVVNIFNKWGFAWGGTWSWTDPMHFEMNRIVVPR